MEYVMVPVPEQHVDDVLRYIVRLTQGSNDVPPEPWDAEGLRALFEAADEPLRSVLSYLALPENAGHPRPPSTVAEALELRGDELGGVIGPLTRKAKAMGRRSPIESRKEPGRNGRPQRTLVMAPDVAELVRQAERAVHAAERVASHSNRLT